jgi:hypothetical protein
VEGGAGTVSITSAGLAVIILVVLFIRGGGGRVAIALAACAGSALAIVGTVWALTYDLFGMVAQIASNIASGVG